MSCRLSSPIMSATPNAYWRTCSMHYNHTRIRLAIMHCILLSSSYLWRHHNVVWPAASQCWKKYGAATQRVSVWPHSRSNASSTNGLGGSSSSGFSFFFSLGASSSAAPSAAAVDRSPAATTPTERHKRKSVWVCAKRTATVIARGGHRGTVHHASAHTEQRTHPAEQKRRGETNDPKSRHTRSGLAMSARDAIQHPAVAKAFLHNTMQILMCVYVLEEQKKIGAQGGTSTQQVAQLDGSDTCGTAPTSTTTHGGSTHPSTKKKTKQKKNTAAGCGCVCVALRVSARPRRNKKQNKRERNVCSAPQALVARPHVTAPSARGASRPLLMRAAGEAHTAVVMSVSVGVRVEPLGGKHTAPLTGRVQQETN
ncbi:hypothetical protein MOQ_003960 [Trypanosoma cruzi marinkellei]|uniref:Uncharacterized protein n=1 Tax=Trypanosoma cruzi marinkellei TaxID=85056 RepID=K2MAN1_TRYCR|nr:hypothetical protein MOQ_003960 [Trypanosoma cruzi marinkellei]